MKHHAKDKDTALTNCMVQLMLGIQILACSMEDPTAKESSSCITCAPHL